MTINEVLLLPPRASCSILVSFESLYGTCVDFPSVRAFITMPNIVKLLFIFFASSNRFPSAPVFDIFSLPAKSTRYSFPVFAEKVAVSVYVIVIIKIA